MNKKFLLFFTQFCLHKYGTIKETIKEICTCLEKMETNQQKLDFVMVTDRSIKEKKITHHSKIRYLLSKKDDFFVWITEIEKTNEETIPKLCKEQEELFQKYIRVDDTHIRVDDTEKKLIHNQILDKRNLIAKEIKISEIKEWLILNYIKKLCKITGQKTKNLTN